MKPDGRHIGNMPNVAHPRGDLSQETRDTLAALAADRDHAEQRLRAAVLAALNEGSFRAVREATGISTTTLQKWKREA